MPKVKVKPIASTSKGVVSLVATEGEPMVMKLSGETLATVERKPGGWIFTLASGEIREGPKLEPLAHSVWEEIRETSAKEDVKDRAKQIIDRIAEQRGAGPENKRLDDVLRRLKEQPPGKE